MFESNPTTIKERIDSALSDLANFSDRKGKDQSRKEIISFLSKLVVNLA
jgi:hypothetical protein